MHQNSTTAPNLWELFTIINGPKQPSCFSMRWFKFWNVYWCTKSDGFGIFKSVPKQIYNSLSLSCCSFTQDITILVVWTYVINHQHVYFCALHPLSGGRFGQERDAVSVVYSSTVFQSIFFSTQGFSLLTAIFLYFVLVS